MEQNRKWYCRASLSTTTGTQCDLEHAGPHCKHSQSAADAAGVPVVLKAVNHGRRAGAHRLCDERGLRGPCAESIKPRIQRLLLVVELADKCVELLLLVDLLLDRWMGSDRLRI